MAKSIDYDPTSLVPFGVGVDDEEDLRFYFDTKERPEDWAARERWERVHDIFTGHHQVVTDFAAFDLRDDLRRWYELGLLPWASESTTAKGEHAALYPPEPQPPHVSVGAQYEAWLEAEKKKPTFHRWLLDLCDRERRGAVEPKEGLVLDQIRREVSPELEKLARRFNGRKAYAKRRTEKEHKQLLDEKRREAEEKRHSSRPSPANETGVRTHRKYGQLPREPEFYTRPKRT